MPTPARAPSCRSRRRARRGSLRRHSGRDPAASVSGCGSLTARSMARSMRRNSTGRGRNGRGTAPCNGRRNDANRVSLSRPPKKTSLSIVRTVAADQAMASKRPTGIISATISVSRSRCGPRALVWTWGFSTRRRSRWSGASLSTTPPARYGVRALRLPLLRNVSRSRRTSRFHSGRKPTTARRHSASSKSGPRAAPSSSSGSGRRPQRPRCPTSGSPPRRRERSGHAYVRPFQMGGSSNARA